MFKRIYRHSSAYYTSQNSLLSNTLNINQSYAEKMASITHINIDNLLFELTMGAETMRDYFQNPHTHDRAMYSVKQRGKNQVADI